MSNVTDPWNIGNPTLKNFSLGFYVIINYLGVLINAGLIWSITRAREKTSRDIFVISLASGCLMMSLPCATQCLFNWVSSGQHYQYGAFACYLEAYFHVSAIMVQFLSIMMIAWNSYQCSVRRQVIPMHKAIGMVFVIWVGEALGTVMTSTYSEIVLMPAGAYCFFDFKSIVIVYWFCPTMIISLGATVFFYVRIYKLAQSSVQIMINSHNISPNLRSSNSAEIMTKQVAMRSSIFVLAYFFGWFPAVIACVYALIHGQVTVFLDTFLAIAGSLNSVWQPLAYGVYNRNAQKLVGICCPRCRENLNLEVVKLRGRETIVTADTPPAVIGSVRENGNNSPRGSPRSSPAVHPKRGSWKFTESPPPLPGQLTELSHLDINSPTKTYELLSPPISPEKKSPDSSRKQYWKKIGKK